MRRLQVTVIIPMAFVFMLVGLVQGEPDAPAVNRRLNLLEMNDAQVQNLSPVLKQVRLVMADQVLAIGALEQKLAQATEAQEIHQLEREMAAVYLAAEIEILEVQARYLRRDGRVAEAELLVANVEELRNPGPRPVTKTVPQRQEVQK